MPWFVKLAVLSAAAAAVWALLRRLVSQPCREPDYTQYPTAEAAVVADVPFYRDGLRQLVRFTDAEGREVLAMHHRRDLTGLPQAGTVQQIRYWPVRRPARYTYKHQTIGYYFRYCDEQIYTAAKPFFS